MHALTRLNKLSVFEL